MSLLPTAEWRGPLPTTNYRTGAMGTIIGVTIHHMDGSWQAAEGRFKTPGASASAHFGVRYDGSIIQWVDTADVAYHACGANWHGWVGIENESDPNTPDAPLTPAQVNANASIIRWLGTAAVPATTPTSGGVGYHRQFPGSCTNDDWGSTACPGDGIVAQIPAICAAVQVAPSAPRKDSEMFIAVGQIPGRDGVPALLLDARLGIAGDYSSEDIAKYATHGEIPIYHFDAAMMVKLQKAYGASPTTATATTSVPTNITLTGSLHT